MLKRQWYSYPLNLDKLILIPCQNEFSSQTGQHICHISLNHEQENQISFGLLCRSSPYKATQSFNLRNDFVQFICFWVPCASSWESGAPYPSIYLSTWFSIVNCYSSSISFKQISIITTLQDSLMLDNSSHLAFGIYNINISYRLNCILPLSQRATWSLLAYCPSRGSLFMCCLLRCSN